MTYQIKVDLMIVFSDDLEIIKAISKYRPNCIVIVPTLNEQYINYLRFIRGVFTVHWQEDLTQDEILNMIFSNPLNKTIIQKAKKAVVLNLNYKNMRNGFFVKDI
jgi:pyruvate kinase